MTLIDLLNSALPRAEHDPYQAKAKDSLAKIFIATEQAEDQCDVVGNCLAFFLEDPPTSLVYDNPAAAAETLANKLVLLANQLRASVADLRSLSAYADQFDSPSSAMGAPDGSTRQIHRRDREVPEADGEQCPF